MRTNYLALFVITLYFSFIPYSTAHAGQNSCSEAKIEVLQEQYESRCDNVYDVLDELTYLGTWEELELEIQDKYLNKIDALQIKLQNKLDDIDQDIAYVNEWVIPDLEIACEDPVKPNKLACIELSKILNKISALEKAKTNAIALTEKSIASIEKAMQKELILVQKNFSKASKKYIKLLKKSKKKLYSAEKKLLACGATPELVCEADLEY